MSVGKKASSGFFSFFLRNMMDKFLSMIAMIVLARKLTPYDFGLVSITEVLLSLITAFGTTGIAEFLLAYREKDIDEMFKATFWFNILISCVIIILFLISAPLWATYQKDMRIVNISFISASIFIFSQLQMVPKVRLSKNLDYKKLVKVQTPIIIMVQLSKIGAVYLGMGVYSLLIPSLIYQPILTVWLFRAAKFTPGTKLYRHRWKEVFSFTKHLIGSTFLARIADQGDKIILSRLLGLEMLGIYNVSMQLADLFTSQFIAISNNVLSSVLPMYADNKGKFYNNYISFIRSFIFIVFPLLGIMIITAKPIILTLYGIKWLDAVVPLQILLIYTATRAATSSFGIVMNTYHLTKKTLQLNLMYTPIHIISAIVGASYGVVGLAATIVVVKNLFTFIPIKMISKVLDISFSKWYKDIAPIWLLTLIVTLVLLVSMQLLSITFNSPYILWIVSIAGVYILVYYISIVFFLKKELVLISNFLDLTAPRFGKYFNIIFRL